jgi:triphosphatase
MESAPLEVELKLEVMPKSLDRLRRHPAFAGQDGNAGTTQTLVSVYYDTPDLLLHRKGLSLRLRTHGKGQKRIQTIKTDQGRTAGLFERSEWEREVDGNRPDISAIKATAPMPRLSAGLAARLKPVRRALSGRWFGAGETVLTSNSRSTPA